MFRTIWLHDISYGENSYLKLYFWPKWQWEGTERRQPAKDDKKENKSTRHQASEESFIRTQPIHVLHTALGWNHSIFPFDQDISVAKSIWEHMPWSPFMSLKHDVGLNNHQDLSIAIASLLSPLPILALLKNGGLKRHKFEAGLLKFGKEDVSFTESLFLC